MIKIITRETIGGRRWQEKMPIVQHLHVSFHIWQGQHIIAGCVLSCHLRIPDNLIQRLLESCFAEAHERNPDNEEYLRIIFRAFKKEKEKLLLLDRNNLSFLLLEIMNSYFFARKDNCSVRSEIHFYYHVGGVFNAFLFWLHEDMKTSPDILARIALAALPADYEPLLL